MARKAKVVVAHVPKTIDNDIPLLDATFGFGTAVQEATRAIFTARDEAVAYPNGVGIVNLMGRHSGFIAAHATMAARGVDVCLVPEASRFGLERDSAMPRLPLLALTSCTPTLTPTSRLSLPDLRCHSSSRARRACCATLNRVSHSRAIAWSSWPRVLARSCLAPSTLASTHRATRCARRSSAPIAASCPCGWQCEHPRLASSCPHEPSCSVCLAGPRRDRPLPEDARRRAFRAARRRACIHQIRRSGNTHHAESSQTLTRPGAAPLAYRPRDMHCRRRTWCALHLPLPPTTSCAYSSRTTPYTALLPGTRRSSRAVSMGAPSTSLSRLPPDAATSRRLAISGSSSSSPLASPIGDAA